MTYKQIETSREIRLWIGQIVAPICGLAAVVIANPEANQFLMETSTRASINSSLQLASLSASGGMNPHMFGMM